MVNEPSKPLWRDSAGRLTFAIDVEVAAYPALAKGIADQFQLTPCSDPIFGPEQVFWDFSKGDQVVGIDWDIWTSMMVVAKSHAAESLVEDIARWHSEARPFTSE